MATETRTMQSLSSGVSLEYPSGSGGKKWGQLFEVLNTHFDRPSLERRTGVRGASRATGKGKMGF
jgi:hypothetical protein